MVPVVKRILTALLSAVLLGGFFVPARAQSVVGQPAVGSLYMGQSGGLPDWLAPGTAGRPLLSAGPGSPLAYGVLGVTGGGTGTGTAFTPGSVVFAGASGVYSQDNSNFFWDLGNHRLGVLTAVPQVPLQVGADATVYNPPPVALIGNNTSEPLGVVGTAVTSNINWHLRGIVKRTATIQSQVGGAQGGTLQFFTKPDSAADVAPGGFFDQNQIFNLYNAAAPATPSGGITAIYVDSTAKRLHDKNDAGTIGTTVVASTAPANQFASGLGANGVIAYSQPTVSNLANVNGGTILSNNTNASGPVVAATQPALALSVAPSTPGAGFSSLYVDSTDKRFHDKNDAGTIGTTVVASTAGANQFATSVSAAGVVGYTQPSFTNLSGSATCAQLPALTTDVTTSAGSCATTIAAHAVTVGKMAQAGAATLLGNPTAALADVQAFTIQGLTDITTPNTTLDFVPIFNHTTGTLQKTTAAELVAAIGGGVTNVTPGGGLVSSIAASCSQTAITTTGTLSASECVNAQSGTSYAIADGDRGKLITASNAAAQSYSLAQAGAASAFQAGWFADIRNNSTNAAGIVTITPTTSTIGGAATYSLAPGQSARIVSDGTNYQIGNTGGVKTGPTTQSFLSGSDQTYTTPTNTAWIEVWLQGGGGAGGGGGTGAPGAGTAGNPTCWKASGTACTSPLSQASGGTNGGSAVGTTGGAGGGTTGNCNLSLVGGQGGGHTGTAAATNQWDVFPGGGTHFGASGLPGVAGGNGGASALANSGVGGSGGTTSATSSAVGGSGGGGGTCYFIINNPTATYVYTVGASAAGGAAGTNGGIGGNGGSGRALVIEHYNF